MGRKFAFTVCLLFDYHECYKYAKAMFWGWGKNKTIVNVVIDTSTHHVKIKPKKSRDVSLIIIGTVCIKKKALVHIYICILVVC